MPPLSTILSIIQHRYADSCVFVFPNFVSIAEESDFLLLLLRFVMFFVFFRMCFCVASIAVIGLTVRFVHIITCVWASTLICYGCFHGFLRCAFFWRTLLLAAYFFLRLAFFLLDGLVLAHLPVSRYTSISAFKL